MTSPATPSIAMTPTSLPTTALAFRGYNVENLGRSHALLQDSRYEPIMTAWLETGSAHAARLLGRDVRLIDFVVQQREPTLAQYGEAVALIMALSMAQLQCLKEVHGVDWRSSRLLLGYSLGEVSALVAGGSLELGEALRAPLSLADDCVALAENVRLGVFFSRQGSLDAELAEREILLTNLQQRGVMGISAVLSPNSMLLMGQGDTLERFHRRMQELSSERVFLRRNPDSWPPMHTPIVWQRNIPTRAAQLMLGMRGGTEAPRPDVLSLVDGRLYTANNVRDVLYRWTDQQQRLWLGVCELFQRGVQTVIHVGPRPNIIPATLRRIGDNVQAQLKANVGMRTLAQLANRKWLRTLLPHRTSLLRAPHLHQVVLEDWLLEND